MSEVIDKLANSSQVTEWLNKNDRRLEAATGIPAPNEGGDVREFWIVDGVNEEQLAAEHVRRIIVPSDLALKGVANFAFSNEVFGRNMGEGIGNVTFEFTEAEDWASCFPVSEGAAIFKQETGEQAWAAVALCGSDFGLAVFGQEQGSGSIAGRIQPVPEEVMEKIILAA